MRRFSKLLLHLAIVALVGVTLTGCDETPTSVNDFEIQPALSLSQDQVTFIAGQNPPPQVSVSYQGLNEAPTMESSVAELGINLVEETGTPENGSRTWSIAYDEFFDESSIELSASLTAQGGGQSIERTVNVQVNNPISITSTIASSFLLIEDYETAFQNAPENGAGALPEIATTGGTTANVQSEVVSPDATGPSALAVTATAGAPVTLVRNASAPGLDVLSFLVKPDPSTDFVLTVTLNEEVDGEVVAREIEVPVQSGDTWLQYNLAVGALFEDFNPVAARAGGNGPLQSVAFTTDQDVSYHLDDVTMGTAGGGALEINDFQETSNAYGDFAEITFGTSTNVAAEAAGPTARSMTWTEGGNFFGYNWNQGAIANGGSSSLRVRVGQVSRDFVLYVFVEAVNDAGGYNFDGGNEVPISAGDGWQEVTVPLSQLGSNPDALSDPGIRNVGFEIRRSSSDGSTEPISFLIDDIRLQGNS